VRHTRRALQNRSSVRRSHESCRIWGHLKDLVSDLTRSTNLRNRNGPSGLISWRNTLKLFSSRLYGGARSLTARVHRRDPSFEATLRPLGSPTALLGSVNRIVSEAVLRSGLSRGSGCTIMRRMTKTNKISPLLSCLVQTTICLSWPRRRSYRKLYLLSIMVDGSGPDPMTSCVSTKYSNQTPSGVNGV